MSAAGSVSPSETQFVSGAFGRLAIRRLGPGGEIPLLLCHRFRGTIDDWDPAFLSVLAAERDVIVFDGPGVGRSSGAPQSTVAEMASAALDLVSQLGLGEIDLLGWSMGGFVAQDVALTKPSVVRRLIVAGSKPGLVPGAPSPAPQVGQIAGKPVNDDEDLLFLFFPDSPEGRAAGVASLRRLAATRDPAVVSPAGVKAQSAALTRWSSGTDTAWERLGELTMPILIAAGAQDRLMDAYNSYAMVRRLPNANLIIYGDAAHAFVFQHAQAFARQVLDFLGAP
ncbi:MAG TPA: alpha/beta hydrolase [Solirubrobacteraceae bacterium]|nr:alpha/beta hydrolase [Solirubrobacteraceae bacterium]